jgi:hypothetical protein
MQRYIPLLLVFVLAMLATGCLTVESKEYRIKLKPDHSGEATIKFVNIMSEADDTLDITSDDFNQLIDFYLQGTQIEKDNPGYRNVKKRLFEENGVLCGEVSFSFDSLGTVRLFRYDDKSPLLYPIGSPLSSEQYVESNGALPREWIPVIMWPHDSRELYIKTKIVSEVSFRTGLLKNYKAWQAQQSQGQKQKKQ